MTAADVAAALEDVRFDARQDSRHEHLADDTRGRAELAEWERIAQLLAGVSPGTVYDPGIDVVVQEELTAEAAAAAREADLREAQRIAARTDEIQAMRKLGTLEQAEPREGDEAVGDELTCRAGSYVQADVHAWPARALAAHLGHYRDLATRTVAAGLLPAPVLAHAALLAELARLVPAADMGQPAFAGRHATPNPRLSPTWPRSSPALSGRPVPTTITQSDCHAVAPGVSRRLFGRQRRASPPVLGTWPISVTQVGLDYATCQGRPGCPVSLNPDRSPLNFDHRDRLPMKPAGLRIREVSRAGR
ncbi:hypothetical protein AB5J52_47020 [Streptomyces sp. R39]|uniref:DUF222 domain-containing protein n=1 Tax=Streptomyces sp. R39 TaxID=3238631 RepID=A0AB39R3T0_9ACTN